MNHSMLRGRYIAIILVTLTIVSGAYLSVAANQVWFPAKASTVAEWIDFVFNVITWISIFFLVLIVGLMFWFAYKYQRVEGSKATSQVTHNTPLELAWTIIPLVLAIGIFYVGMIGYLNLRQPPLETYDIRVTAQRWSWTFDHPNGASETGTLHVPVDIPVRLILQSQDVIHSLFIPAFRVKMDAVPGRITDLWFQATKEGEYDLFCAEYCGKDHSQMTARVLVRPEDQFRKEITDVAEEFKRLPDWELPKYAMEKLRPRCASCHLLEDRSSTGPSWRETHRLLGKTRVFTDGSEATVDENYIRESISEPQKHIVANFTGAMPTFKGQLHEQQVNALVLLIKFLDRFDDEGKPIKEITDADFYPSGTESAEEAKPDHEQEPDEQERP